MGKIEKLIQLQSRPFIGRIATEILSLYGIEFPSRVQVGSGLVIHHRGQGIIVTPSTTIGNDVTIYQQVTIGRSGVGVTDEDQGFVGIIIDDGAILCAGAKVLGGRGTLRIGKGTVVGANSVLTCSTGEFEVWAGAPARKVGDRRAPGIAQRTSMTSFASKLTPGL